MAQNTTVDVPAAAWTQLTDSDVSAVTYQNNSTNHVFILATVGSTAPTSILGAIRYNAGQGERNASLTDLFPGLSGANRVWAYAPQSASVMVSHA